MSIMSTNTAGTVAIDRKYHWIPIDANTPRGVKLQLINRRDNVATYGVVYTNNVHWTHWAPLPTFADDSV